MSFTAYNLMEDAATAEISRSQVWQWVHHPNAKLADGREVTAELVHGFFNEEIAKLEARVGHEAFRAGSYEKARQIIEDIVMRPDFTEFMTTVGYEHRGNLGIEGREAFRGPEGMPRHHLYVCLEEGLALRNHLALRDYLRAHPDEAAAYGALKQGLAARFPEDIDSYVVHKTTFVIAPNPIPYTISFSYMNRYNSKDALADGVEPSSSNDEGIAQFTFWNHRGTAEWVQYNLPAAPKVSSVSLYLYDDTGDGESRVPQSWKLLYKNGDAWIPVEAENEYGTRKDKYNTVKFKPVETTALRIEIQLQRKFSGGILEWKVGE